MEMSHFFDRQTARAAAMLAQLHTRWNTLTFCCRKIRDFARARLSLSCGYTCRVEEMERARSEAKLQKHADSQLSIVQECLCVSLINGTVRKLEVFAFGLPQIFDDQSMPRWSDQSN